MNDVEEKLFHEVKNSALLTYDTLEVMVTAITSSNILLDTLLSPIELLQKELMNNIVHKIDDILNI